MTLEKQQNIPFQFSEGGVCGLSVRFFPPPPKEVADSYHFRPLISSCHSIVDQIGK